MQCLNMASGIHRPRPPANFSPDLWGDRFLNYTPQDQTQEQQEAQELKEIVREKLMEVVKEPKERLEYIDAIHRLGVGYHFENEIEDNLQSFHKQLLHSDNNSYEDDLHYVALRFRLLRQHGFHVSCDVFEKFKCENGSFKNCLASDVQGLLSLYEASYLRFRGETTLDEAIAFAISHMSSFTAQCPSMAEEIARALKLPLHKRNVRVESRYQISLYESRFSHDKILLRFAKLDFNILQELHKKELRDFTRWSKSLDLIMKLPNFKRDRVVEIYFWTLGTYHEPKYAYGRMCMSKILKLITITDDMYDSYGTIEELEAFTKAIKRWDKSCITQLPEYMRLFYEAFIDTFAEIDQDLTREGQSYAIYHLKQQLNVTCEGYLREAKWREENCVPQYEDYVKNGILSSAYLFSIAASYVGMGKIATKNAYEWLHPDSKVPKASCIIARLLNDLSSHKYEKKRDHVGSAVDSYMAQFGASEEETNEQILLHIEEAWKDMNQMVRPTVITMPLLTRVINLSRVLYDYYDIDIDRFTMSKYLQPKVAAVLIDPIKI